MKKDIKVNGARFMICLKGEDFEKFNLLAKAQDDTAQGYLAYLVDMAIKVEWDVCMDYRAENNLR
jgi:hypothetical protein